MARSRDYYARKRDEVLARARLKRESSNLVRAWKPCRDCGLPAISSRHWYCETCRRRHHSERDRLRWQRYKKQSNEKYGPEHQKLRREWAKKVAVGTVCCWRCLRLIAPNEKWHLGHDDFDESIYRGPEHVGCNCATAGRKRLQKRVA